MDKCEVTKSRRERVSSNCACYWVETPWGSSICWYHPCRRKWHVGSSTAARYGFWGEEALASPAFSLSSFSFSLEIDFIIGRHKYGKGPLIIPGIDKDMFSGQETNRSICVHISLAAWAVSKLNPTCFVWSEEQHIVWNAFPATWYEDKLSMVSFHNMKHVPLSARAICIRLLSLARDSPMSNTTTGIPVNFNCQSWSEEVLKYKLAKEPQTYTWKFHVRLFSRKRDNKNGLVVGTFPT